MNELRQHIVLFDLTVIAVSDFKSVYVTDRLNTHLPRAPLVLLTALGHAASVYANAVFEFMPESGNVFSIRVSAMQATQIFVSVRDAGCGNVR